MNRFYFNTGVKPMNVINFPYDYHKKIGNVIRGTLLVPFDCDAPENAEFMFACNNSEMTELKQTNVQVYPILGGNLISKYAYFRIKEVIV
jgi:hypothetical protein